MLFNFLGGFMDISIAPIPEQIAHCEDAIECLKSRLRFYRRRLKKLNDLMNSSNVITSNPVQESDND